MRVLKKLKDEIVKIKGKTAPNLNIFKKLKSINETNQKVELE